MLRDFVGGSMNGATRNVLSSVTTYKVPIVRITRSTSEYIKEENLILHRPQAMAIVYEVYHLMTRMTSSLEGSDSVFELAGIENEH